ncbi:MAG: hypothetical protein K2Q22_06005 [Cytophagales bacterium]|nr:hypothetical protein [Cytophagales bacterium]
MDFKLDIGDVATSDTWARYTCFGLGSCIGLFIQDRMTGASGGAHILLPESELAPIEKAKYYNVHSALNEIITRLRDMGNPLDSLRAKITGGANVLGVNLRTGQRNVDSVIHSLTEKRIYLAASDIGGTYSRTAIFESSTGLLTIKIPQINLSKTL